MDYEKARILIVDDQRAFHVTLKGMLINLGVKQFQFAENAESAIRLCRAQKFDFLLVDYNLGHGKNGRQMLDELKSKGLLSPSSSFFIVTGDNSRSMVLGALEHQPDDYLMKPFSISQLDKRLRRAQDKRKALLPVFKAIHRDDDNKVIELCQQILSVGTRYGHYCNQLLAGYYRKTGQYKQAEQLLDRVLKERDIAWAKVEMAHIYNQTTRSEQVAALINPLLKTQPMLVDAYDCLADSQYQQGRPAQALETLKKARAISPIAAERQLKLAKIAREAERYDLAQEAYKQVYDIKKGTYKESPEDLCNYVRAGVEATIKNEGQNNAQRFENDAFAVLYRARHDTLFDNFDVEAFGELMTAYKSAVSGELLKAKKLYYKVTRGEAVHTEPDEDDEGIEPQSSDHFLPESIYITSAVGEFDESEALLHQAKKLNSFKDNPFFQEIIKQQSRSNNQELHERIEKFNLHNNSGKKAYAEGNNKVAVYEFEQALECAPTNTGAALNLIQALLKLLGEKRKVDAKFVAKSREVFRIIDGMNLPEKQQQRRKELWQQFGQYRK